MSKKPPYPRFVIERGVPDAALIKHTPQREQALEALVKSLQVAALKLKNLIDSPDLEQLMDTQATNLLELKEGE